jgi:hypothetical protein
MESDIYKGRLDNETTNITGRRALTCDRVITDLFIVVASWFIKDPRVVE